MRDWPLLLVATLLLLGGGGKAAADGNLDNLATALLAAGLVVLGAWVAVEVRRNKEERNTDGRLDR